MPSKIICLFLLLMSSLTAADGDYRSHDAALSVAGVSEPSPQIAVPVQFLEHQPSVDGVLDSNLTSLSVRLFTRTTTDNPGGPIPAATYRLAYGTDFFYVYIEAKADSLVCRDRAYQMGDGFHMVIAKPIPDGSPTEEFYVLACSAVNNPRLEWTRHIFWYYNVYDIFRRTSDDTKFESHDGDGVISFELLLPWKDIIPYHPWISERIGFNLRFVKAAGEDGIIRYDVVPDDCIDCELHPRYYALLEFERPVIAGKSQTYALPERGHCNEGDSLMMTAVVAAGSAGEESVTVSVLAGEGDLVDRSRASFAIRPGITRYRFEVDTRDLIGGGYSLKWKSATNGSGWPYGLTILPRFDPAAIGRKLDSIAFSVGSGTLTTLRFKLGEVAAQVDSAKPYETCMPQRFRLERLRREIDEALNGNDPYRGKTGFVRRAYLSDVDSTLQPYMVYVPADFDTATKYPLLVYLHGSASTEFDITGAAKVIPDGFIAVAPRGRGTSNCFTRDHAQEDIAEAIAAVIRDYSIDTSRIVLCGFSMGGYGVYRTFYETPNRFKALVVLSGHPDLANAWYPGRGYPDFTGPRTLRAFKETPMFIYHGEADRNAPFEITKKTVAALKHTGCPVEFHTEPDKGHEAPSDETYRAYYDWIKKVLAR